MSSHMRAMQVATMQVSSVGSKAHDAASDGERKRQGSLTSTLEKGQTNEQPRCFEAGRISTNKWGMGSEGTDG